MVSQTLFVLFSPLDQVGLGIVVGQEGYPLLPFHWKGFAFHGASCLLVAGRGHFSKMLQYLKKVGV